MRVSEWAGLNKVQAELDFVDVDPRVDTRLFLDPYALEIKENVWSHLCAQHIRSFFGALLAALRRGQDARAEYLASHLHEAGETYLGLSRAEPQGRGIGQGQALRLLDALRNSRAMATGVLSDLAEAELFIEGIGHDKISDLTTNVIRGPLLEYTRQQAALWNMPIARRGDVGPVWIPEREEWQQDYREVLVVDRKPVILVPKHSVRRVLTLNSQEFYNNYFVEYLRAEHLNAHSSLVKVLQSGERRVYKKDVKDRHPKSKNSLAEFAAQHPQLLESYKRLAGASGALGHEDFDQNFDESLFARALIERFGQIGPGNAAATEYHHHVLGTLTFLLYPDLINPVKEHEIDQGRKRIDISFTNASQNGFFHTAMESAQLRALYVPVECKSYSQDLGNPELDQLCGRFSLIRGNLGLLCCRRFDDKAWFVERCRDAARHRGQFVIALDDADLVSMLDNVSVGARGQNDNLLRSRLRELTD